MEMSNAWTEWVSDPIDIISCLLYTSPDDYATIERDYASDASNAERAAAAAILFSKSSLESAAEAGKNDAQKTNIADSKSCLLYTSRCV